MSFVLFFFTSGWSKSQREKNSQLEFQSSHSDFQIKRTAFSDQFHSTLENGQRQSSFSWAVTPEGSPNGRHARNICLSSRVHCEGPPPCQAKLTPRRANEWSKGSHGRHNGLIQSLIGSSPGSQAKASSLTNRTSDWQSACQARRPQQAERWPYVSQRGLGSTPAACPRNHVASVPLIFSSHIWAQPGCVRRFVFCLFVLNQMKSRDLNWVAVPGGDKVLVAEGAEKHKQWPSEEGLTFHSF